ncbi:MAG: hypothetical protein M3R67_02950 [Acidobacteriota bacterium]|nr:hypothetical protein [Acidobacteriota bacterium]
MNIPRRNRSAEIIGCKVALLSLISVAALSNAVKDLNRIQELAGSATHSMYEWFDAEVVTVQAKGASFNSPGSAEGGNPVKGSDEFHWKGRVASGKAIEIKRINGDIDAQPAACDEIEVLAKKKARMSDPNDVRIQVVEHSGGVTICAMYPPDNLNQQADCVAGNKEGRRNQSTSLNARNNDVRVDFTIRVPAGVEFVGRTINGEITAKSLGSNGGSRTVNGSLSISTTAYAKAKTVNRNVPGAVGNANPAASAGLLKFKTLNRETRANLPSTANTGIEADTFNDAVSLDVRLPRPRTVSAKHLSSTIANRKHELILKHSMALMCVQLVDC